MASSNESTSLIREIPPVLLCLPSHRRPVSLPVLHLFVTFRSQKDDLTGRACRIITPGFFLTCIGNVYHRYDQKLAIKDISLNVARSEILALLGTGGSGKSTLLAAIAGIASLVPERFCSMVAIFLTFLPKRAGWVWCFGLCTLAAHDRRPKRRLSVART